MADITNQLNIFFQFSQLRLLDPSQHSTPSSHYQCANKFAYKNKLSCYLCTEAIKLHRSKPHVRIRDSNLSHFNQTLNSCFPIVSQRPYQNN